MTGEAADGQETAPPDTSSINAAYLFVSEVPELDGLPIDDRENTVSFIAELFIQTRRNLLSAEEGERSATSGTINFRGNPDTSVALVIGQRIKDGVDCQGRWLDESELEPLLEKLGLTP